MGGDSNPGQVAEAEGRHWLAFDISRQYLAASIFRFASKNGSLSQFVELYQRIISGETVCIPQLGAKQMDLPTNVES